MCTNLGSWYKGECRAPGLYSVEESEVISVSESIGNAEEEPDLDLAYDELECVKRRVQQLRSMIIVTPADPCEEEVPPVQEDLTLLTPNQILLLQLRRNNCVLRCQLGKLTKHLQATRTAITTVQQQHCRLRSNLNKMTKELKDFEAFKLTVIHHFGLCIERNEHIKASKVNEFEFAESVRKMISRIERSLTNVVPMRCHNQLRYQFAMELFFLRIFLHNLFTKINDNWVSFRRRSSSFAK